MPTAMHHILRAFKSKVAWWLDLKLNNYRLFFSFLFTSENSVFESLVFVQQSNIEERPWEFFNSSWMRCSEILEPGNNLPAGAEKKNGFHSSLYFFPISKI